MTLSVDTVEAAKSQSAANEMRTIMTEGAQAPGPTAVVAAVLNTTQYDGFSSACANYNEAIALAIIRISRSFPQALPAYAYASLPSAATYPYSLVYVSNGAAGLPIVAFSDGSNWLRMDTRTAVTP